MSYQQGIAKSRVVSIHGFSRFDQLSLYGASYLYIALYVLGLDELHCEKTQHFFFCQLPEGCRIKGIVCERFNRPIFNHAV